ncbi:MAG: nicotinate-nucleotide adenylyltransferase [Acidimicrobiales bacterium]
MAQRVGILGGTFDPIHVGHLVAAVNCRDALNLDLVLLMVANEPWQKVGSRPVSPALDRLALVEACVAGVEGLEAGRTEIDRGGPSYTVETLRELRAGVPPPDLYLIVGWDVASSLQSWDRWEEIRDLARLVVVNRPGVASPVGLEDSGWRVETVEVPNLEISSTDLRERARDGRPLDYLIPARGVELLRRRGMYCGGEC